MVDEFITRAHDTVDAMIREAWIPPEARLHALVMFAAFIHGPRVGLIAHDLNADIKAVGEIVENLDRSGYFGSVKMPPAIVASWPEMFATKDITRERQVEFLLDVLVAKGLVDRRQDESGEFVYFPRLSLTSRPNLNASVIRAAIKKQEGEFTSADVNSALGTRSDVQVYVILRQMEVGDEIQLVRHETLKGKAVRKVYRQCDAELQAAKSH